MTVETPADSFELISEDRQAFLNGVAGLIDCVEDHEFPRRLSAFVRRWIPFDVITIFEFRSDLQPRLMHWEGEDFDVGMEQYLGGLYLLDPFYEMFAKERRSGVFHMTRELREEYESPESYQAYIQLLGAKSEIGVLYDIDDDVVAHLSLTLPDRLKDEADRIVRILRETERLIQSLFRRHMAPGRASADTQVDVRRHLHLEVSRTLRDFGADRLTAREQDIAQLLLRGHSAKSIARILDISPGTASIHRSNIYQKLGVAGQGELFAQLLGQLTRQ